MLVNLYLLVKLFAWTVKAVVCTIVVAVVAVFVLGYALVVGATALFYLIQAWYYTRKADRISEAPRSQAFYSDRR